MGRFIVAFLLIVGLCGCGESVTKLVNQHFPPVNIDSQRQAAIDSAADALGRLTTPNMTINLGLNDIQKGIFSKELRGQGIRDIAISGNDQLLYLRIDFAHKFVEEEAGDDPLVRELVARLHPEVAGHLQLYMGVTATTPADGDSAHQLEMRLLPGLAQFEISEVRLAGREDATAAARVVSALLERYRDNITGVLTRHPLTSVSIPSMDERSFDLSKQFTVSNGEAGQFDVTVSAEPVSLPLKLDGIVWLIDADHLRALIQLTPLDASLPPSVSVDHSFNQVRHQFTALQQEQFGTISGDTSSWIAIKKDVLALSMNAVVRRASACVALSGNSVQKTESKISLPDGSDLSCSIERNCDSNRVCSFEANHDTRDCSTCILNRPVICSPRVCVGGSIFGPGGCTGGGCTGGGCAQMGNDPTCEAAKAAQNLAYLADANLKKADCDRLRAMETTACQVEVNAKKALCDTEKTALQALSKTGNFANLDMEMDAHSDNLKVCMREFNLTPDMEKINLAFEVSGQADADVDLKFVPLDIVGHLTCQFPWQSKKTFHVALGDSQIRLESALTLETNGNKAGMRFRTSETTINARMSPSPIEYLLTSQEMTVACQGINLLKPVAIVLTPFVKQLRGEFDYKVKEQEALMNLPLPNVQIGEMHVKFLAGQTPKALLLSAKLEDAANADSSTTTALLTSKR